MINSIQRDQRRRILALRFTVKRIQYKALSQNGLLSSQLGKFRPFLGTKKQVSSTQIALNEQKSKDPKAGNTKNKDSSNCKADAQLLSTPFVRGYQRARTPKIVRSASLTRVQNRCILTARSRGVLRFCKLSRIRLRELASQGLLSGVSKASW